MYGKLIGATGLAVDGEVLAAELYQTSHRITGRRAVVFGTDRAVLFDTKDCYDLGNAQNALDNWLAERVKAG